MVLDGDTIVGKNKDRLFLKTQKKFSPQRRQKSSENGVKCSTCCYKIVSDPIGAISYCRLTAT